MSSWRTGATPHNERFIHRRHQREFDVAMLSDWGRPTKGIFQTAFVVEDLSRSSSSQRASTLVRGPSYATLILKVRSTEESRHRPRCTSRSDLPIQ